MLKKHKIIFGILLGILISFNCPTVFAMHVMDSYSETNRDSSLSIDTGSGWEAGGQSFTGDGSILDHFTWYLQKRNSPSDNCFTTIYAHTGTYGTSSGHSGSILATSDAVNSSTFATSYTLTDFAFSGGERITLTNGTHYVAVLRCAVNGTHSVDMGRDDSSPTAGGNAIGFDHSGFPDSETTLGSDDFNFYAYGYDAPTPTPTPTPSSTPTASGSFTFASGSFQFSFASLSDVFNGYLSSFVLFFGIMLFLICMFGFMFFFKRNG